MLFNYVLFLFCCHKGRQVLNRNWFDEAISESELDMFVYVEQQYASLHLQEVQL